MLFNVYEASLIWDGHVRTVEVNESEADPLVGMSLLVLDGRNKASISTAQWFAFVSPFERFRHCTIEVLYKV